MPRDYRSKKEVLANCPSCKAPNTAKIPMVAKKSMFFECACGCRFSVDLPHLRTVIRLEGQRAEVVMIGSLQGPLTAGGRK
jgi:hypothetical protein